MRTSSWERIANAALAVFILMFILLFAGLLVVPTIQWRRDAAARLAAQKQN
jgi:hypothetical protein